MNIFQNENLYDFCGDLFLTVPGLPIVGSGEAAFAIDPDPFDGFFLTSVAFVFDLAAPMAFFDFFDMFSLAINSSVTILLSSSNGI
jgi:hypothetical protein